jgi:hypothetical protein
LTGTNDPAAVAAEPPHVERAEPGQPGGPEPVEPDDAVGAGGHLEHAALGRLDDGLEAPAGSTRDRQPGERRPRGGRQRGVGVLPEQLVAAGAPQRVRRSRVRRCPAPPA